MVRGALVYKTLLIWPYAVAPAIAGALWAFLFAPSVGILSYFLRKTGYHWDWVLKRRPGDVPVIVAAVWKQISYNFLFFLAGLQSIPKSLIEAAAIDGAGPGRRFRDIVFPLLSPTTFFLLVVNIVYAFFDTFGVIDSITQGGPAGATQILVYKVYYDGVKAGRPRRLLGAVGGADGDRHRADSGAVPLRGNERSTTRWSKIVLSSPFSRTRC